VSTGNPESLRQQAGSGWARGALWASRVAEALERHPGRAAFGLFVLALTVRLAFVLETDALTEYRVPSPGLDIDVNLRAAQALRGELPEGGAFALKVVSAPLFPALLAALSPLIGSDILAFRLLAAVLTALRTPLMFWVALRVSGRAWAALATGLLTALLPSLVLFDTIPMKTGLELNLLAGLLALTVRADSLPSRRGRALSGLAVGALLSLTLLTQLLSFTFILPVLLYAWLAPGWTRAHRRAFALPALGLYLVTFLSLQAVHRLGWSESFLPRAGADLRIGWNPFAGPIYTNTIGIRGTPDGHTFDSRLVAEKEAGRPLTVLEADRHHLRAVLGFVLSQPARAAALLLRKVRFFFNAYEPRCDMYLPALQERSAVLGSLPSGFALLVAFAPLGLLALHRRARHHSVLLGGLVLAVLAVNCLVFVTDRFRLPSVLPLSVLVAPALVELARASRESWSGLAGHGALVAAALGLALYPVPPWYHANDLTLGRRSVLVSEHAATQLARLRELDGGGALEPAPRLERARLLWELHRHDECFAEVRELARVSLADPWVDETLLRYLVWLGRYDEAAGWLGAIQAQAPQVHARLVHPEPSGSVDLHLQATIRNFLAERVAHKK
jgi:hypothetical protein